MDIGQLRRQTIGRLAAKFGEREATAMVRLAFFALAGWDTTQMILRSDRPASGYLVEKMDNLVGRLLDGEPIQYILGMADFYGMVFKVRPGVLIPRPETAQLVDWIADDWRDRKDLSVLDVGTGTGCIAVALALNLPFSSVTAIDLNPEAVILAKENAMELHAGIKVREEDIFQWTPDRDSLDIIVSNPPYIPLSERGGMESHVADHEPENALFVPDDDPLRFYVRIADVAAAALRPGGAMYFEIHPPFASGLADTLANSGWNVEIRKDMYGRQRLLKSIK